MTLPRLAVFWEDQAFSLLEIAEAGRGLCDIVWIIGWSSAAVTFPIRAFQRLGELVDLSGQEGHEIFENFTLLDLSGVIAFTDPPLPLAAVVAELLGVPFYSPQTALKLSDKLQQRQALRTANIPVPGFRSIRPSTVLSDDERNRAAVTFPAVLKPQRGAGSRDTFFVANESQLRSALEVCEEEDFILEEYIEDRPDPASRLGADMVSVETVVQRNDIHHLAVTGRFPLAAPFRETGSFLPSDLSPPGVDAVLGLATAATRALEVDHGVLHTEIKMSPTGPQVIEVNGRVGGGIPRLLAQVGGPPLLVWSIRLALSLDVGPFVDLPPSPVAFFRWILAPITARRVLAITGVEETRALPGVEAVSITRRAGSMVDAREGGTFGHVVAIAGKVADHEELRRLQDKIESRLSLTFSD